MMATEGDFEQLGAQAAAGIEQVKKAFEGFPEALAKVMDSLAAVIEGVGVDYCECCGVAAPRGMQEDSLTAWFTEHQAERHGAVV